MPNDPSNLEKLVRIQTYHSRCSRTSSTGWPRPQEGDGSLLDHSIILYGSNMSNSDRHDNEPLPSAIFGPRHDRIKGGQHVAYPAGSRYYESAGHAARAHGASRSSRSATAPATCRRSERRMPMTSRFVVFAAGTHGHEQRLAATPLIDAVKPPTMSRGRGALEARRGRRCRGIRRHDAADVGRVRRRRRARRSVARRRRRRRRRERLRRDRDGGSGRDRRRRAHRAAARRRSRCERGEPRGRDGR